MALADLNDLYTQASAALDAEDFDAAIRLALKAKLRLATMPDVTRSLGGMGTQSVVFANAEAIDVFISQTRQMQNAAAVSAGGGIRQTKIRYARAGNPGGCE